MMTVISQSGAAPVKVDLVRADGRRVTYERAAQPTARSSGPETGAATAIGRDTGFGSAAREALFSARAEASATENSGDDLTPEQREVVSELAARDREVRRHEEAHARVGGAYAGQPSYTYQQGPDGKRYAIGGEVAIDVAPIAGDPQATIAKMAVVKRAALAPAEPSGQDRRVAALADAQSLAAQAELRAERAAEAGAPAGGLAGVAEQLRNQDTMAPGQLLSIAA